MDDKRGEHMAELEKVINALKCCDAYYNKHDLTGHERCQYSGRNGGEGCYRLYADALKLLKEQQETKERILRTIADYQLAVSPTGYETEEDIAKRTGEWNGLQIAYEIVEHNWN